MAEDTAQPIARRPRSPTPRSGRPQTLRSWSKPSKPPAFRPAGAWYLNDAANIAYANAAANGARLQLPVLYVNGEWDPICDINRSRLGNPMRGACTDLSVSSLPAGHWLPLERKTELIQSIRSWLDQ